MGVPLEPLDGDPLAVYGDDFGVTEPDSSKWLVINWDTGWAEYFVYGDTEYPPPNCSPGISHFIYQTTGADCTVVVEGYPISGNDTLTVEPVSTLYDPPAPGWNMFANPYDFTIDWSDAYILEGAAGENVYSLSDAADSVWISRYAYIWDHIITENYENILPINTGDYSDSLSVWQGFWFIQLDSIHQLKLVMYPSIGLPKPAPTAKALNSMGMKYRYRTSSVSSHWDWFLKLGVVSENYKMQDVGNGIGESSLADDAYDSWDAFEFRGQDFWGNFVQLEFIHDDRRSFSYDIHAPFSNTSEWKFRVTTNSWNTNMSFSLVWPQIRLVPETIKFSLFDSDKKELVDDLRSSESYSFELKDSTKIFYIKAFKEDDIEPPEFSFLISQNIFVPNDLTVYIVPSEPLEIIQADFGGTPVDLTEIPSPPYVYYAKKYLAGSGSLTLEVKGTDRSGNTGNGLTTIQYQLMKANENNKLTDKESGVELYLPKGILPHDVALVLNRSKMNLTIPPNMIPKGDPIYIGPEPLDFKGHALLTISELPNSSSAGLYRHSNGKWEYISTCSKKMKISETGIYQIFCKSNNPDGTKILPGRFILHRCYPNPFNSSTMIRYDIQQTGDVSLIIYDILGREVKVLVKKQHQPGFYNIKWDGKNNYGIPVASGNYFINLKVKDGKNFLLNSSKKVTLIK